MHAYQEGQGAVKFDRQPDLFAFMGATQVELAFIVAPDIASYQDVKGKSLALDAVATGFADHEQLRASGPEAYLEDFTDTAAAVAAITST